MIPIIKYKRDFNHEIVGVDLTVSLIVTKQVSNWVAWSPDLNIYGYSKESKNNAIQEFSECLYNDMSIDVKGGTIISRIEKLKEDCGNINIKDDIKLNIILEFHGKSITKFNTKVLN